MFFSKQYYKYNMTYIYDHSYFSTGGITENSYTIEQTLLHVIILWCKLGFQGSQMLAIDKEYD